MSYSQDRHNEIKCQYCGWNRTCKPPNRRETCRTCKHRVILPYEWQAEHYPDMFECPKCQAIYTKLTAQQADYLEDAAACRAELAEHEYTTHRDRQILARLTELTREAKYHADDSPEWIASYRESSQLLKEWWAHPEYQITGRPAGNEKDHFIGTVRRIKKLIAQSERREDGMYCQGAFGFRLTPEFEAQLRGEAKP